METEILIQTHSMTTDLREGEKRYLPQGAIISSIDTARKMTKWMEIAFELASPVNRQRYVNRLPWFQPLIDHWRKEFRDARFEAVRDGFFCDPVSGAINRAEFWQQYVVDSGLKAAIGKESRGQRDLMETWIWGSKEKAVFLPASVGSDVSIDASSTHLIGSDEIIYKSKSKTVDVLSALLSADVTEAEYLNITDPAYSIETDFDRPVSLDHIIDTVALP
jgi:hypothetical protein